MEARSQKISCRVAGIALHQRYVLLHRAEFDPFWALPGGGIEYGETAEAALMREMREEIATEVTVGRLLFVVENFFTYRDIRYHEIGLYFQMDFAPDSPLLDLTVTTHGTEAFFVLEPRPFKLLFEWTPLVQLSSKVIKPNFLAKELPAIETFTGIRHIVNDETTSPR
jgi:ADP-ribose pyrophosphatase YjhB (NUDIX family)